jgi:hypothetical protein
MRLWSIHPAYLDAKGLVAAWREGLLAQKVLEGKTRGYTRHAQLLRFRDSGQPLECIAAYLSDILAEAGSRGYAFDGSKILRRDAASWRRIPVTLGQLAYEMELLRYKLERRDPERLARSTLSGSVRINGAFRPVPGEIENWERAIPEIIQRVSAQGVHSGI